VIEQRIRDRVTGAVILVSLAAIFLPMVLDGEGVARRDPPPVPEGGLPRGESPQELEIDAEAWEFVKRAQTLREQPPLDARPQHVEPEQPPRQPTAPGFDAADVPEAWAVQVGSFEHADNARALRDRLLEDGFEAYMTQTRRDAETLRRVAVGPRLRFADAEALKEELKSRYELRGLLVRFELEDESAVGGAGRDRVRHGNAEDDGDEGGDGEAGP